MPDQGPPVVKEKLRAAFIVGVTSFLLLSQVHLIVGVNSPFTQHGLANQSSEGMFTINLDGDLKANITAEVRDIIWKGNQPREPDWFAGDPGQSQIKLGYNFTYPEYPTGECEIRFIGAYGNRPFVFSSVNNEALKWLYLDQIRNLTVHFDINLRCFNSDENSWLRTSVVVALQNEVNGKRLYFEQDIQDNNQARLAMPVTGSDVFEDVYASIPLDKWVHLDVPFESFIQTRAMLPSAKPFFDSSNSTFLESVYIVNECFGSGYVRYSIANWWITVEPLS